MVDVTGHAQPPSFAQKVKLMSNEKNEPRYTVKVTLSSGEVKTTMYRTADEALMAVSQATRSGSPLVRYEPPKD